MAVCVTTGDALLAFWRCDKKDQQQTVTNVMKNGLTIQENYDNFKAGEGINLRMKIAISIGDIFVYHLGTIPYIIYAVVYNWYALAAGQHTPGLSKSLLSVTSV